MATWVGATAKQIARAVRRGDTSATQVVADHLDHIDGATRSSTRSGVRGGEAIAEAETVDEQEDLANLPLAGVPVAVKENIPVAGLPTWNGSAAARSAVAEADHEVVRRLRGAGAVVVGVTRMPELGLWALTDDAERGHPQPVAHRPHARRLVRWRRRRGRGRAGADRARQRRARLDPDPGRLLRSGRASSPAAAWSRRSSAPTTGSAWPSTACSPPPSPTRASGFAVLAGWAPPALVEPARLRVAVSLAQPGARGPARPAGAGRASPRPPGC